MGPMMGFEVKMIVSTPEERRAQFDRVHEKSKAIVDIILDLENRSDQDAVLKIVKHLLNTDRRVSEQKTMDATMKNPAAT